MQMTKGTESILVFLNNEPIKTDAMACNHAAIGQCLKLHAWSEA